MKKILKKIALISFLLALVAGTMAFFFFQKGSFSEADLRVEIIGPQEVEVGEEVIYKMRYRNNSDIRLEEISVVFEYPEVAVPIEEDEIVKERENLRRERKLDNLNPGQEETIEFKARVFGQEGDEVKAIAWFNYSPQNLSSRYEVKRTHTGRILEVPLSFEFDLPKQMEANEEFPFRMRFFSKLNHDLENLGIKIEYPSGFEFVRSTPSGMEDNEWERDYLGRNEGGVIEIFGKLKGEAGDIKGFNAQLGVWKFDRFITLKQIEDQILIPQPGLFVDVLINDSTDYVAEAGEDLLYDIYFKNVGDEVLESLFLTVDLDKEILNMDKVETMGGRFQREAGSIIWSHSSFSELRRLRPDEEGKVSFWAEVKEENLPYDPEIVVSLNLDQRREEIRTKISTVLELKQGFVVGENDPFKSIGPFPLSPEIPSTYTAYWKIENQNNDVKDLIASVELPEESLILNKNYPEGTEMKYNSATNELIWEIEKVEKGVGINQEAVKAYFQVEIKPISFVEKDFKLVPDIEITGRDIWTKEDLRLESFPLFHINLVDEAGLNLDSRQTEIEFDNKEEDN